MGPASPATIWNVPHRRNPNFSDQRDLVGRLRASLTSGRTTALTAVNGMGGVGKTQLALEYCYRFENEYKAVLWVPSEEPAALALNFAGLARELSLPEQIEADQIIAIEAVRRWLGTNTDWLLVFDNAPGPDELQEFLPNRATGHVIITSRFPNWGGVANSLPVAKFSRDESIIFLQMHGGETDRDSADELAEELGDLPLALEQARAYMERTGGTLSYYLGLYRDRFQELWQQDEPPQGYDQTIATTWSMSIGQLPQAAADLLNICAFFAPDDIPRELIAGAAVHLPEPLASVVSDVLVLDQAVAELRSYSLLEAGGDSWSAHRLVQGVVRGRLDNDDRNGWAEAAAEAMRAAFPYDSNEVENWPTCSRLLAHALAAASHSESQGVAADATGFILNQVSLYLRYRARFLEAKSALERAVKIGESELGSKDPMVATRLSSLGVILGLLGDSEGARNHIERAVNIHEAAYGLNHTQVANDLNNLGNVLMDLGDLEGARDHIQRAVNINEANGSNHQDFATQLYSLGNVLRELGDLDGAREHAQRAVEIDEAIYGPENPEVAKDLGNLGHVLRDLGDLDGAREHSQRALNILEAAYGPHHLDVGTASNHLAGVLWAIGDSEGAREHLQRSLGIYEEIFGLDHPNVAIILNNLGTILHDLGDVEGAREHMRRALDIARDSLGEEHPTTLLYRQNLESLSK